MDSDPRLTTPQIPAQRRPIRGGAMAMCLAFLLALCAVTATVSPAVATAATSSVSARTAAPVVVRGCTAFAGAKTLGATYTDAYVKIYACGMRPSFDGARNGSGPVVLPYTGSNFYYRGYQCIELVARFLKARYNANPGVANGAQAVDRYAAAYPAKFTKVANGTKNNAPRRGDVLSLASTAAFSGVGHTGIVIATSVNTAGNGSIRSLEENWGGTGGASGYHVYAVKNWRVISSGLTYVKWLRAR